MVLAAVAGLAVWKKTRPFRERDWEEFFPDDLNAFVAVELGREKAALLRASALYSILADPDVASYARKTGRPVEPLLRALDGVESAAVGERRGKKFFAARGPAPALDRVVRDALSARAERGEEAFDYVYKEFRGKRGRDFAFLEIPSRKKLLLGGSGGAEAERLVESFLAPPERTLKDSGSYGEWSSFACPEWVLRGFFDAAPVVSEAIKAAELAGGRGTSKAARPRELARVLGLDRLRCLAFSSAFDGAAARDTVALSFDGRAGLFEAARESDLSRMAESYVPKSAIVFAALSLDPAALLDVFKSGLPKRAVKLVELVLAAARVRELLPALGNDFAAFVLPGLAAGWKKKENIGFILRLKDPQKAEEALRKGLAAAKILAPDMEVREFNYGGVTIRYFERPRRTKLTPALAITDDAVLFGLTLAVVRRMLHARAGGEGAVLASRKELRPMLEKARACAGAWCVSWDQLLGEAFGLAGFWLDAEKAAFPADAVVEKLFTGWGVVSVEATHVRIESRDPFGLPALMLLRAFTAPTPAKEGEIF